MLLQIIKSDFLSITECKIFHFEIIKKIIDIMYKLN